MTDKTTQEPVLYQRWYQGVWFKVNPGDVEKLESDGWSIRRLYAEPPAPVAVALLSEAREWLGDGKYSDGLSRELWTPAYAALIDKIDGHLDKVKELNQ